MPALTELVHRNEPFAIRLLRVATRDDEMASAEVRRHFIEHDFREVFPLLVAPRRQLPFGDI
jgi:hypothetical protein